MNHAKEKIRPNKSWGQNFLIDKKVLEKIIETAGLVKDDVVIEIGAGTGILTKELSTRVKKVIAFEIDKKLIPILQGNLKKFENVEIRNEDILKIEDWQCLKTKYKIVANIPYNITSAVLEKFLSAPNKPAILVLLVQREVAERICASPSPAGQGRDVGMSVLSVMVQFYGAPKIIKIVPPSAFSPQPKVESAILKIEMKDFRETGIEKHFFQIVKAGFSQRRRMLKNNLRVLADEKTIKNLLQNSKIKETARAEEISLEQWLSLAKIWS